MKCVPIQAVWDANSFWSWVELREVLEVAVLVARHLPASGDMALPWLLSKGPGHKLTASITNMNCVHEREAGLSCIGHTKSGVKTFAMVILSPYIWYRSTPRACVNTHSPALMKSSLHPFIHCLLFGDRFFFFVINLFDRNKFKREKSTCLRKI